MSAGPGVVNPRGRRWHHAAQAVRMSLDHADATSAPRGARWVRLRRTQRTCLSLTALSSKRSSHHEHRHPYRHTPSHGAGPAHRSPRTCADPAGAAMSVRSLVGVAVAVVAVVVLCAGGIGALFTGGGGGLVCAAPSGSAGPTATISAPPPGGAWPRVGRWDSEQVGYAATIIAAGTRLGVPPRGWVIAVATAMQESDLRNPPGGPDDSIGLFQQRPSQGWGTPAQLADPDYAPTKYFQALLKVPGWQTMALTDAAQAVQKSAFPDAYAKWEPEATILASALTGAFADCSAAVGPMGWVAPVRAPIVSGFRTPDRPTHDGVDLGAARGTPIHAASTGVVTTVRCNISPPEHGCDRDGSPQTPGCGWYVD